jgi:hypothetical protein
LNDSINQIGPTGNLYPSPTGSGWSGTGTDDISGTRAPLNTRWKNSTHQDGPTNTHFSPNPTGYGLIGTGAGCVTGTEGITRTRAPLNIQWRNSTHQDRPTTTHLCPGPTSYGFIGTNATTQLVWTGTGGIIGTGVPSNTSYCPGSCSNYNTTFQSGITPTGPQLGLITQHVGGSAASGSLPTRGHFVLMLLAMILV